MNADEHRFKHVFIAAKNAKDAKNYYYDKEIILE